VKILVADDDPGSRLVAQSAVQALGHECVTAANGDEAWQLTMQLSPDVVVTDRDMPGLDGIALCHRIREEHDGYTYIILLTALDHPDQVLAGMQGGADDYLTKPLKPFDLQTRLLAAARVTELHAELARARAALEDQMHTDPLTGLRNRVGLTADLEHVHNVSERYHHSYCIAMCDIDFFKAYNDTYGHPAGDQALRAVAATLTAHVRKGDRIYRYGGEEFLILLPEQTMAEAATALNRVRAQLHTLAIEHRGAGRAAVLTISVGLAASRPAHRVCSSELVAQADTALYEAKTTGRDRIALATALVGQPSNQPIRLAASTVIDRLHDRAPGQGHRA
jgi:diguanylate cyclase (GGDEF)-like protein